MPFPPPRKTNTYGSRSQLSSSIQYFRRTYARSPEARLTKAGSLWGGCGCSPFSQATHRTTKTALRTRFVRFVRSMPALVWLGKPDVLRPPRYFVDSRPGLLLFCFLFFSSFSRPLKLIFPFFSIFRSGGVKQKPPPPSHALKRRNECPSVGDVSTRSRNGAPSRKGCVAYGQNDLRQATNECPLPSPPLLRYEPAPWIFIARRVSHFFAPSIGVLLRLASYCVWS